MNDWLAWGKNKRTDIRKEKKMLNWIRELRILSETASGAIGGRWFGSKKKDGTIVISTIVHGRATVVCIVPERTESGYLNDAAGNAAFIVAARDLLPKLVSSWKKLFYAACILMGSLLPFWALLVLMALR